MHIIDRKLNADQTRRFLAEREVGNVAHFYRNLRTKGHNPQHLGWIRKEGSDRYAVYGGSYEGGSADTDTAVEILQRLAPFYYEYEGPKTELEGNE